jgi:hypothetical protein
MGSFIRRAIVNGWLGGAAAKSSLLNGLTAYWSMNEASNGSGLVTRVDPISGLSFTDHGNTPSVTGINSNAANLVATSSNYFSHVDHALLKGGAGVSFEFAVWMYQTGFQTGTTSVINKTNSEYYSQSDPAGDFFWNCCKLDNSGWSSMSLTACMPVLEWFLLFFGYDFAQDKPFIRVNVSAARTYGATTCLGGVYPSTGEFRVGHRSGSTDYHSSYIDEMMYWRGRVLTSAEETQLFNLEAGFFYPFSIVPNPGITVGSKTYSSSIGV